MSNIYTFPTHFEDDISDTLSSMGTKSTSLDSLETPSPHFANLSEMCDIDAVSSQTKKIRKKRCAYDKIDDEKRIQLLNAVQKCGESLKSAAKRLDINYSSAKSILHTFRKEGRILKKSPLESGTRTVSLCNLQSTSMDISPMNSFQQRYPSQGSLPLARNPTGSYNSSNGANSPMRGLTSIFANLMLDSDSTEEEPSFVNLILETSQSTVGEPISIPKLQIPEINIFPPIEESPNNKEVKIPCLSEITCNPPLNQAISNPLEVLKKIDNFYMNYSNSPLSGGKGIMFGECSDSGSRKYCGEFDSFSEMMNAFQSQVPLHEEIKGDFQIPMFCRFNSGQSSQDRNELKLMKEDSTDSNRGAGTPRFDSQWLLTDSLRKASFLNNLSQLQRPGISLINERNK